MRIRTTIGDAKWIIPLIATLALVVRVAPLFRSGLSWAMDNDSPRYIALAEGLRTGCGFAQRLTTGCAEPEVLRTPGYPVFLMMMPDIRAALFVQAAIGALVCLIIGMAVSKYWGEIAGATAALLLALDVPSIVNGDRIMSDVPFQALVTAAICLELVVIGRGKCDRGGVFRVVAAAVLSGAAILVRPIGFTLPIFAGAAVMATKSANWRKKLSIALLAFAIPSAVLGGWMVRNRERTGVWTLSTAPALPLYYFGAAGVLSQKTGEPFPQVQQNLARAIGSTYENYIDAPARLQAAMTTRSLEIYLHYPLTFAILSAESFLWLVLVPDRANLAPFLGTGGDARRLEVATSSIASRIRDLARSPLLTILVTLQFAMIFVTWLGIALAIWSIRKKSRRETLMILFLLSAAALLIAPAALPAAAMSRYRLPGVPLFAMLAGIGYFGKFRSADEIRANDPVE